MEVTVGSEGPVFKHSLSVKHPFGDEKEKVYNENCVDICVELLGDVRKPSFVLVSLWKD